jgi:hypothetical protein
MRRRRRVTPGAKVPAIRLADRLAALGAWNPSRRCAMIPCSNGAPWRTVAFGRVSSKIVAPPTL